LLFASASCAEIVTAAPATGLALDDVTRYLLATPTTVVKVLVVPVVPPVVPVAVCAVPAVVLVVNETVATPLAFVVDVAVPKVPPPVLDHVTTWPAVDTALLFASASCAVIVTAAPATGLALELVTRYFVAAPATVVNVAVVPVLPPVVPVAVCAVPATVLVVKLTVAMPAASVLVVAKANVPPPVLAHVTT
jgi:hypothetical protein